MNRNDHTLFEKHWSLIWPTGVRQGERFSAPLRLRSVRAAALEEAITSAHGCCGDEQGLGLLWHPATNSLACAGCFGEDPFSFPAGDTVLPQHVLMRGVQRTPAGCTGPCLPRAAAAAAAGLALLPSPFPLCHTCLWTCLSRFSSLLSSSASEWDLPGYCSARHWR